MLAAFGAQIEGWHHWVTIGMAYGSGIVLLLLSTVWISRSYYQRNDSETIRARKKWGFQSLTTEQQQPIIDRHFSNQIVVIDGKHFTRCTFRNVTMQFDGTAPFSLSGSHFEGIQLKTDSPTVSAAWILAIAIGAGRMQVLDDKNQPVRNIVPPTERKPNAR